MTSIWYTVSRRFGRRFGAPSGVNSGVDLVKLVDDLLLVFFVGSGIYLMLIWCLFGAV